MIPYDEASPNASDGENQEVKVTIRLAVPSFSPRVRGRQEKPKPSCEYISKAFLFDFSQPTLIFWMQLLSNLGPKYEANFSPLLGVVAPFSWRLTGPANRGLTVETEKELDKMFKELRETMPPTVMLEMKDSSLEVFRRQGSTSADLVDSAGGYSSSSRAPHESDLSPTEASKARFTLKLKERWKCAVHGCCYKPSPGGNCIQMNATALGIWSSGLHEGTTTIEVPPNHKYFDPATHKHRSRVQEGDNKADASNQLLELLANAFVKPSLQRPMDESYSIQQTLSNPSLQTTLLPSQPLPQSPQPSYSLHSSRSSRSSRSSHPPLPSVLLASSVASVPSVPSDLSASSISSASPVLSSHSLRPAHLPHSPQSLPHKTLPLPLTPHKRAQPAEPSSPFAPVGNPSDIDGFIQWGKQNLKKGAYSAEFALAMYENEVYPDNTIPDLKDELLLELLPLLKPASVPRFRNACAAYWKYRLSHPSPTKPRDHSHPITSPDGSGNASWIPTSGPSPIIPLQYGAANHLPPSISANHYLTNDIRGQPGGPLSGSGLGSQAGFAAGRPPIDQPPALPRPEGSSTMPIDDGIHVAFERRYRDGGAYRTYHSLNEFGRWENADGEAAHGPVFEDESLLISQENARYSGHVDVMRNMDGIWVEVPHHNNPIR